MRIRLASASLLVGCVYAVLLDPRLYLGERHTSSTAALKTWRRRAMSLKGLTWHSCFTYLAALIASRPMRTQLESHCPVQWALE